MLSSTIERFNEKRGNPGGVGEDAGFTLIELMVVLLILAILLAIAIPTFLGVTKSANDRASQSNLNTALVNAKAQYQSGGQTYFISGVQNNTSFVSSLQSAEPALGFVAGAFGTTAQASIPVAAGNVTNGSSGNQSVISLNTAVDGNGIVLAAYSKSGNCWYVVDNTQALTDAATTGVAPYTQSGGISPTTTTQTMTAATAINMPTAAGDSYIEVKGDSTTSDCNAYTPKAANGAKILLSLSGYPSI
jgi:type IV pilus assembly protein PilA